MSDPVRDRVDATKVGEVTTHLTLAVALVDAFTGRQPRSDVRVAAPDADATPVVNPSGYHLFLDLPAEPFTVVVDGGQRYLDVEETVDPVEHDPPVVTFELRPSPAYRFPPGATVLRGVVRDDDGDGDPIPDATVSVRHTDRETVSDSNGEFVLFFTGLTANDVQRAPDGRRLVQVATDDPVVDASHPEYEDAFVSKPVKEKSTTRYEILMLESNI